MIFAVECYISYATTVVLDTKKEKAQNRVNPKAKKTERKTTNKQSVVQFCEIRH
eukprot:m.130892 g.130892  ORF g.130892 m.130892 type:complete len:54 (+) comp38039_c0_seq2:2394-2555(+)